MADDPRMADYEARKKASAEATAKAAEAQAQPPTPTQEENDMAMMGIPPADKPAARAVPRHDALAAAHDTHRTTHSS
jgi:hypothetical protein